MGPSWEREGKLFVRPPISITLNGGSGSDADVGTCQRQASVLRGKVSLVEKAKRPLAQFAMSRVVATLLRLTKEGGEKCRLGGPRQQYDVTLGLVVGDLAVGFCGLFQRQRVIERRLDFAKADLFQTPLEMIGQHGRGVIPQRLPVSPTISCVRRGSWT